MSDKSDPRKPFYFIQCVGNLDGTMDLPAGVSCYETEAEALAELEEEATGYNMAWYVFLCKPVYRAKRKKLRIERLP